MINLISDTVTRPTAPMLQAMMKAEVGDDVFGQDPTANRLEQKAAAMFGKEAGLFCPSGTMCNQIALQLHCGRLEEVLCDRLSHVYQYETGGYAYNGQIPIKLIEGDNGILDPEMVQAAVNMPPYDWLPVSRLLVIENSCNKGGGNYYTKRQMQDLSDAARQMMLKVHLDGARIFNVLVETGDEPAGIGPLFDTISICLSKGLGAPVGSLLLGDRRSIAMARRLRKVMGGGMRQTGYLAAAGIYALDHHIERLKADHGKARRLSDALQNCSWVGDIRPVHTNILIFDLADGLTAKEFVDEMEKKGVLCAPFGPSTIRFVTHMDVSEEDIDTVANVLSNFSKQM